MAMWGIFYSTIVLEHPKYELHESIIGTNPGLGFRPMPPESNVESTLIWFEEGNKENTEYWVNESTEFLSSEWLFFFHCWFGILRTLSTGFTEKNGSVNGIDCTKNSRVKTEDHCKVDFKNFGDCTKEKGFGFEKGKPCIFLKLNKIYNWEPSYYELSEIPEKMPESLQGHIKTNAKKTDMKVVWVSCEGENPADIDNLGPLTYKSLSGEQGFLGKYFPFMSTEGYLQPIVAVQFQDVKRE
jgi:sodium/potassium-transporting ATPase subunit beta